MADYKYVWFAWSVAFLCPWILFYLYWPEQRRAMLWSSGLTSLLGLTEPVFVPEYWNPPSLFDLAQRTGFDIESLIFSFAIGGIGVVLYNAITGRRAEPMAAGAIHDARHRFHRVALALPYVAGFPAIFFLPVNAIYSSIAALALGAVANVLCRPDLLRNTLVGGLLFLGLYAAFMLTLIAWAPGYVGRVWNLPALSGFVPFGIPLEELLFGFAFGLYWAGVYEHFTWHASAAHLEGEHA